MSVVVTGSTGHIGANLVRALLDKGVPTRALIHEDRRAIEGLDVDVVAGDVRNRDSLLDAFAGAEVVYHLAADISLLQSEWPLLEAVNIIGARNVVEACLHCRVRRLIHFSSIHAMMQGPMDILPQLLWRDHYLDRVGYGNLVIARTGIRYLDGG